MSYDYNPLLFRKSARIVGDVLGKYHPHGDEALFMKLWCVWLSRFSMRVPLVDGQRVTWFYGW